MFPETFVELSKNLASLANVTSRAAPPSSLPSSPQSRWRTLLNVQYPRCLSPGRRQYLFRCRRLNGKSLGVSVGNDSCGKNLWEGRGPKVIQRSGEEHGYDVQQAATPSMHLRRDLKLCVSSLWNPTHRLDERGWKREGGEGRRGSLKPSRRPAALCNWPWFCSESSTRQLPPPHPPTSDAHLVFQLL